MFFDLHTLSEWSRNGQKGNRRSLVCACRTLSEKYFLMKGKKTHPRNFAAAKKRGNN